MCVPLSVYMYIYIIYGSDGETGGVVRFRCGSRSQAPGPVPGSVPREHWGQFGFCGASL